MKKNNQNPFTTLRVLTPLKIERLRLRKGTNCSTIIIALTTMIIAVGNIQPFTYFYFYLFLTSYFCTTHSPCSESLEGLFYLVKSFVNTPENS